MARCEECLHYCLCAKEGRMVQIDEHTWDDYNQLDDVERFCENYIHTANVAPRADVAREIFERLYAHRKYDGHTVSVWVNDLICIAKEWGVDLQKYESEGEK